MTQGSCPSCGAEVRFSAGTARIVICAHCQTVVARTDGRWEAHGRAATIVDTDSPLQLGVEGRYRGTPFALVGHLQKSQGQAPWDEWYVQLEDGRSAWLAESEGALHWMFPAGVDERLQYASLKPGMKFQVKGQGFVAEEVGQAQTVAAAGQLPEDLIAVHRFVDATGPQGVFASLDFGERTRQPDLYVGHQVTMDELGIRADALRPRAKQVALASLRCTQCNGPLELKAPDRTLRVGCPYCGALLEVSGGKLSFLQLLTKPKEEPVIPLGAKGRLADGEWTCIGFLVRSCEVEGVRYPWEEYLLFQKGRGFSWLLCSNGHWTHLRPIPAGEVQVGDTTAHFQGRKHKVFGRVQAVTEYVLGECYWRVEAGEKTWATEYVAPPHSVNEEYAENEVSYTAGVYLPAEALRKAFGLEALARRAEGIAPTQPNPHQAGPMVRWAALWAAAALGVFALAWAVCANQLLFSQAYELAPGVASGSPESMRFSPPLELKSPGNVQLKLETAVSNDWLGLQVDLVHEQTGEVHSVYAEASYYHGVEGGERWSEGSRKDVAYVSRLPAGTYVARLTPVFAGPNAARRYSVSMRHDVPRSLWLWLTLLALAVWPAVVWVRAQGFETRRWQESTFSNG